jgi:hypothetical protein
VKQYSLSSSQHVQSLARVTPLPIEKHFSLTTYSIIASDRKFELYSQRSWITTMSTLASWLVPLKSYMRSPAHHAEVRSTFIVWNFRFRISKVCNKLAEVCNKLVMQTRLLEADSILFVLCTANFSVTKSFPWTIRFTVHYPFHPVPSSKKSSDIPYRVEYTGATRWLTWSPGVQQYGIANHQSACSCRFSSELGICE